MPPQRNEHYRAMPYARANYDRLCRNHGTIPTPADIDAIRSVIGPVSTSNAVRDRFEAALLFFLPRSAIRFEDGSLLIGWVYEDDGQTKREVWFTTPRAGRRSLCHVPGAVNASLYSPQDTTCDEWHPVIFDIVDPNANKNRIVQYAYFKACISLLQAATPPPSVENLRSASNDFASTSSATIISDGHHQTTTIIPQVTPQSSNHQSSSMVDLTASDEEVPIKPEVKYTSTLVNDIQAPNTQLDKKIQAFRDKLDKKEVEELQQMLEKELPSWIKKLAEDVLQKKMFKELEIAESLL
jgi:hypothetical protein